MNVFPYWKTFFVKIIWKIPQNIYLCTHEKREVLYKYEIR